MAQPNCATSLDPLAIIDESLAKIERLDPSIEAWVHIDREGARRTARQASSWALKGPLYGLPVGIKDIFDVAGMPTKAGSPEFAHYTPKVDSAVVAKLRKAGAIVVGKTATTQFAFRDPAPTHNPWNLEHTPGGSSSGSAAAVAAGMVPFAIGSQTVGSTLRPAAYCGIVGFKPTYGAISTAGAVPLSSSLDHVGLFARTVSEVSRLFGALAEHKSKAQPKRTWTIGLPHRYYKEPAGPETVEQLKGVITTLLKAGADIKEVTMPASLESGLAGGFAVLRSEAAAYHQEQFAKHADGYRPGIRELIESGLKTSATEYIIAQQRRQALHNDLAALLEGFDALLLPIVPGPAPRGLTSTGPLSPFLAIPTFVGFPTIGLPSGLSPNGLPLAIQLMAGPNQDANLLNLAAWSEKQLAFTHKPPLAE